MISIAQMDASSWPRHLLGMDQGSLANDQATGDSIPHGDLSCFLCISKTTPNNNIITSSRPVYDDVAGEHVIQPPLLLHLDISGQR